MIRSWIALATILLASRTLWAASDTARPLHPPVALLDHAGESVVQTGRPVSTMQSCGRCHDTSYIAAHSYHVSAGRDERFDVGSLEGRRAWDWSTGSFGRWNPLFYRYLTPPGDRQLDLGVAEWIQIAGWRHVGGGPAVLGHGQVPLDQRNGSQNTRELPDPDRDVLNADASAVAPWDWQASGTVEMNCFLCHLAEPDNEARVNELSAGRFGWAGTATLQKTGLVQPAPSGWQYRAEAFQPDGTVTAETLRLQEPNSDHCGQCHGETHRSEEPLTLDLTLRSWSTATKGQVFSAQRLFDSAVNLAGKPDLGRPWDVHAASMLECSSCHFALNDPASYEPTQRGRPQHLRFEPRRLAIGQYLQRPSHQFAKGQTAQGTLARHLDGTMRRCEDCHDAAVTHEWLPYRDVHFARLSCEACHIPQTYAPAIREVDWTLLQADGQARTEWRGIEGRPDDPASLVTGFRPVLLPRIDADGQQRLTPHNLIATWFWVAGGPAPRPVRLADLRAALLVDGTYHPDILDALDVDGDGQLDEPEAILDQPVKVQAVRQRLIAVGVQDPQIQAELQPYGLHHGVGPARSATRACQQCHTTDSRLGESVTLAARVPGGIVPRPVGDSGVRLTGTLQVDNQGQLLLRPSTREAELYVLGHDRWSWVNWIGMFSLAGVLVGVIGHTALRLRVRKELRSPNVSE